MTDQEQPTDEAQPKTRTQINVVEDPPTESKPTADLLDFVFTNAPVVIKRIALNKSIGERARARFALSVALTDEQVGALPIADIGYKMLNASRRISEGKNTFSLSIKREFASAVYAFDNQDAPKAHPDHKVGSVVLEPVLQPTLVVAEGEARLEWTAQGLVDSGELSGFVGWFGVDGPLTLSTERVQLGLPLQ